MLACMVCVAGVQRCSRGTQGYDPHSDRLLGYGRCIVGLYTHGIYSHTALPYVVMACTTVQLRPCSYGRYRCGLCSHGMSSAVQRGEVCARTHALTPRNASTAPMSAVHAPTNARIGLVSTVTHFQPKKLHFLKIATFGRTPGGGLDGHRRGGVGMVSLASEAPLGAA